MFIISEFMQIYRLLLFSINQSLLKKTLEYIKHLLVLKTRTLITFKGSKVSQSVGQSVRNATEEMWFSLLLFKMDR